MTIEAIIRNAYDESNKGVRTGDSLHEVEEIRSYIRSAESIIVPNWNDKKIMVINSVLEEFGIHPATHLQVPTSAVDLTPMPAIFKARMALDSTESDLVIARGRLGVPGSGSMLVIMDKKGRILSAALSSPHILHHKSVEEAVHDEITTALLRLGFERVA
ncbi:DUF3236 domain-containing protein [Methanospirillum hungatei]|uniref:DUF3236 domain-containing protein n=1 Tax=Methanospirillum hungatei TaxID=2203 RepID=UPI0026F06015|nr:DUF3236 domain-containing protein [Methanospirillum hungatei]MCA1916575.1 DUF3236 domain-containing protein [Methanospirillum hungatei]